MKKNILITILISLISFPSFAGNYEGFWIMKDEKFMIKIVKSQNDEYKGYVSWLKYPKYPEGDKMAGQIQVDRNNEDPNLQNRKVLGLQNVGELKMNKKGKLKGGWVYDTWNGNKYYGSAKLIDDNTLSLKGSIDKWGILGYSMKAYRVNDTSEYFDSEVNYHN